MNRSDFPRSVPDFVRRFSTEAACWEYLRDARWPEGFVCPRDRLPGRSFVTTRGLWVCRGGHHISVTSGTAMHRTKIPLWVWFRAAHAMATERSGISALQLARHLGLHYETAYMILQRLRAGTKSPPREPLHGPVEVGRRIIGPSAKGVRGQGSGRRNHLVICAVEARSGRVGAVRLQRIRSSRPAEIRRFLLSHVARGSRVSTDGGGGYGDHPRWGYRQGGIEGSSGGGVSRQPSRVHRVLENLKAWLNGTHHGVSSKHLQDYLDEFAFRINLRRNSMAAFHRLLSIGVLVPGPRYKDLYARRQGWMHPNPPERYRMRPARKLAR